MTVAATFPDLAGRTVVVTGAADGIGYATTSALLQQGAKVIGIDIRQADHGGSYRHIDCDLRNPSAIAAAFSDITHLDHVVNVAGIDPLHSLEEGDASVWDNVVNLDLRAYYLVIRAAVPLLRQGNGRSIVNVSSINYRLGVPKRSIYSAAKSGILGLTRGLARELGADGIRINTVSPGWIFTPRQEAEYFTGAMADKHLEYLYHQQSIRLHLTPSNVAAPIVYLLSDISCGTTGSNVVVDAGWLLE